MEHHITDDMLERVIRSRPSADALGDSGETWYRDEVLRSRWGDEFIAMHDLAEALRECRTDRAALMAVAKAARTVLFYPGLKEYVGTQTFDPLDSALASLPAHLRRECEP